MKVLVTLPVGQTRDTFITPEVRRQIEALGEVTWNEKTEPLTSEELKRLIGDKDVCITGWGTPQFDEAVLEAADRLRVIAHTAGTVATLVTDGVYDRGIKVVSGNQVFAESVAEGTLGYILASLRDIPLYDKGMHEGKWKPINYYIEGLLDQTVGLVGFGSVAQHLVRILEPFRVRVKVYAPFRSPDSLQNRQVEFVSLEEVLRTSKIISIHESQRPDTYHLINEERLAMIPDGAVLVNTSRGSLIDEEALARELAKKRFKAVLDVYETEPLPPESKLRELDNVILIPHMGGPTPDRRKFATMAVLDDINRYKRGEALQCEISRDYALMMTR